MKKILSVLLITVLVTALFVPAALANQVPGYYYVKTDNGKGLNVRATPDGTKIGVLNYGTCIYVTEFTASGWARFDYGMYGDSRIAWVSTRYLVSYNPGAYVPSATAAPVPVNNGSTDTSRVLREMNAEFKTGKSVSPSFTVYARPSRASGWVNLRWAPSTEAERIATCTQGRPLTVIGETRNWYQVQDPSTGMVGFISKQFVSR